MVRVAVVLVLAALLLPALLSACPLCKEAEADTPGGSASLGRGFYYSILLMIAVPWTAVGTVAFLIFRKRRRDRAALPGGSVTRLLPDSRGARS
jgi:heme/copper-type cytochrome/quinol oxidase subunit 2